MPFSRKKFYLDEVNTAKIEAIQKTVDSQQKQIKKLFATNTNSKMRAFCVRDVHESKNEDKEWDPGRTNRMT